MTDTSKQRERNFGRCNDECLKRIAARLCRLNSCGDGIKETSNCSEKAADDAKDTCCAGNDSCSAEKPGNAISSEPLKPHNGGTMSRDPSPSDQDDTCCARGKLGSTSCCAKPAEKISCCSTDFAPQTPSDSCTKAQAKSESASDIVRSCGSAEQSDDCCSTKDITAKICCSTDRSDCEEVDADGEQADENCGPKQAVCARRYEEKTGCCTDCSLASEDESILVSNEKPRTTGKNENIVTCISKCGSNEKNETLACSGEKKTPAIGCTSGCCSSNEKVAPNNTCADYCCDVGGDDASNLDECVNDCCRLLEDRCMSAAPSACGDHLEVAFKRYENLILMGKCLCRTAIEQLGFSCCAVNADGSIAKPSTYLSEDKVDLTSTKLHARCSLEIAPSYQQRDPGSVKRETLSHVEETAARDHVVLNVSGMTCTGCSRKMMNVLDGIPGVSHARVTFVSGTAEFDVDTALGQTDDVLRRLEKETGFKCLRIVSGYQHLDVLASPSIANQFKETMPSGVESIDKLDKKTYRITYNPRTIGARSVLPTDAQLAPLIKDTGVAESKKRLWQMLSITSGAAAFSILVAVLNWSPNSVPYMTKSIVSLVLATVVQGLAIPEFYVGAIKSLVYSHVIEMDMLVVISITAAYAYSVIAFALTTAGYHLEQEAFFETSALLITLVLLGRLMAAWARARAVGSVSVSSLQDETALLQQSDGTITKIDARLLQYDDKIMIPAHSRVITDGEVVSGESAIDESMVTGESVPIPKQKGDIVIAGTINGTGTLCVHVTRIPGENSISDIANLVENALGAKPKVQDLADKVASWFIPAVVALAIVTFAIWIGIALAARKQDGGGAVGSAITYAIAVLAVSCPCAIGLAVPMVLVIVTGVAARAGVVIKAADAVERGFKVTDVVFDKTGTLTRGDLKVVCQKNLNDEMSEERINGLVRTLVQGNQHPVSAAVANHLENGPHEKHELTQTQSIPGAGIQACLDSMIIKAGNPYWLGLEQHEDVGTLLDQGLTLLVVALNDQPVVAFGLSSSLRDEATTTISELQRRNITCHIVSGDSGKVVEDVARKVGVESFHTAARRSPAEKQQYLQNLQSSGKVTLFCGDGTNDAVAVAQADVGVQIGSASDVTKAVSDVVLLGGLGGILTLLNLSRAAFRRIVFNFVWSAIYNLFAILLAAGAFVKFRIPPGYAGLGEIVSVGPVVIAAATLTTLKKVNL